MEWMDADGGVDLTTLMRDLGETGLKNVEGRYQPTIHSSFFSVYLLTLTHV